LIYRADVAPTTAVRATTTMADVNNSAVTFVIAAARSSA
jgi:hypothetical protein